MGVGIWDGNVGVGIWDGSKIGEMWVWEFGLGMEMWVLNEVVGMGMCECGRDCEHGNVGVGTEM